MTLSPPIKRRRVGDVDTSDLRQRRAAFLSSLVCPVSPPTKEYDDPASPRTNGRADERNAAHPAQTGSLVDALKESAPTRIERVNKRMASPFQLTKTRGLSATENADTVTLHDILGDPLIKKAYIFNYCFDVEWTMRHFDADVRNLVEVKIVHGSWRNEDINRLGIERDLKKWRNVREIRAYLPHPFGTHHSKMMILFKHDDTAQVVIHTANMLEKDWDHMTQAIWKSPVLPKAVEDGASADAPFGTGERFKHDLQRYIKAYGNKLKILSGELSQYDFSMVRGALIASVPSAPKVGDEYGSKWGHLSLRDVFKAAPHLAENVSDSKHLVCQISSIATLPASWLNETIVKAVTTNESKPPTVSITYPTPGDIRNSLTGYATGGSIHTKIASAAQMKQVNSMKPYLCRWGVQQASPERQAHRHLIPPHIKTYICFKTEPTVQNPRPDVEWALVTSANLSQQAWGEVPKPPKGVKDSSEAVSKVSSFEIGVLLWPDLFRDNPQEDQSISCRMVPVFGRDIPEAAKAESPASALSEKVIGLRMPYDLPLTKYTAEELPWSPSAQYHERDRHGQTWR